jgi:hypothetical protein
MAIGMSGPYIHHLYVQLGAVLLLPEAVADTRRNLAAVAGWVFAALIFLNLGWIYVGRPLAAK